MIARELIGRTQNFASRSRWSLRLAILLRNQCQSVIRHAFNDSNDIRGNGESRLVHALAKQASWIVDVGANVGDWTAEVLAQQPGCHALLFDPSREAIEALHKRFGGNKNIEVVPKGLSDKVGHLTFFEEPGAGKTSSFATGFSQPGAERRVAEIGTLDEELNRRGIAHVDFLKVDAEGYDMQVLRGASGLIGANGVDAIQFEYNSPWATSGGTLGEAMRLLVGNGYSVFALKSSGLFTFDYALTGEFFGYANFLAASARVLPTLRAMVVGSIP